MHPWYLPAVLGRFPRCVCFCSLFSPCAGSPVFAVLCVSTQVSFKPSLPLLKICFDFFSSVLPGWQSCVLVMRPEGFQIKSCQTERPLCHRDATLAEPNDCCLECPHRGVSQRWSLAAPKLLPVPLFSAVFGAAGCCDS